MMSSLGPTQASPLWHPLSRTIAGRGWRDESTVLSPCRAYRYRLGRVWDPGEPRLAWVLNTCTAHGHRYDPIRRCAGFARAGGYGGVEIGALYALIGADGHAMRDHHPDPVGPDNDAHLAALCLERDLIVLAWGGEASNDRAHDVAALMWRACAEHGGSLAVLGWTDDGHPRHPRDAQPDAVPECCTSTRNAADLGLHELEDPRWGHLLGAAAAGA
jgi:hypothetical protein